jgi:DNA-binding IclR family transcriptional regulator
MVVRHPNEEPADLIRSVSRALRVLEAVGQSARGLTVKQIARRCELTTATTYHLIRTLAYEGYVTRRDDGTYTIGLEITDRFHELVTALRAPDPVLAVLRRAVADIGYSHFLGSFRGGQPAITTTVVGHLSPHVDDLLPGFDDGAHATAVGKALLATLSHDQRLRYLKDQGMRAYTPHTLTDPEALEADIAAGEQRGMQTEVSQYRDGVACAAVLVQADRDPERRLVLGCAMPADRFTASPAEIREHLRATARTVAARLTPAAPAA